MSAQEYWQVTEDTQIMPQEGAEQAALYIRPDLEDLTGAHGRIVRHIAAVAIQAYANRQTVEVMKKLAAKSAPVADGAVLREKAQEVADRIFPKPPSFKDDYFVARRDAAVQLILALLHPAPGATKDKEGAV